MKDMLVLLTKKYPFDHGEEFLENEIPILCEKFEKVLIIATSVSEHPIQTRSVPANTDVQFIRASTVTRPIPFRAASLFFQKARKINYGLEERKRANTLKKKLFLFYFLTKSELVYQNCLNILEHSMPRDREAILFYSYWFYDTALAAIQLKKSCGIRNSRVVSRAHRYDLYDEQSPAGYLPLRKYLLENIDKVYPCSQNGTDYLNHLFPGFSGKIETSYLGTNDFGLSPENNGEIFHVVSCCHVSPVKRVDLLAKALAELKDCGLKLQWTHFGGGDGLQAIKDFAESNLSFMETRFAGEIKNQELMEYYRSHPVDCFINTSSSEGLPVSIMEACSFGIPVIATDVGGTREIVKDQITGFLLNQDCSPKELSKLICRTARMSKTEIGDLRAFARKLWLHSFCSQNNYAQFAENIKKPS